MFRNYSSTKIYLLVLLIDHISCNPYKYISGPFTFEDGRSQCVSNGMDLAIIKDNDMQNEVNNFLTSENGGSFDVWIGLIWNKAPLAYFTWVNCEQLGSWSNWDLPKKEPNCMEGAALPSCSTFNQSCVRIQDVSSNWLWKTHGCDQKYSILCQNSTIITGNCPTTTTESITTDLTTTIKTTANTPTTTESITTDLSTTKNVPTTTESITTDLSTTSITTSGSEMISPTSPTHQVTESATTTVSSKTNPTTTTEPTEPPMITTTKQETSFKQSTESLPVGNTTLGTFFINNNQVCSCQLLSNRTNLPEESWNFKIDKRSTNAYIRQHTSAYDGRLSSRIMGYTGVFIVGGVLLFVLFADVTTFIDKKQSDQFN